MELSRNAASRPVFFLFLILILGFVLRYYHLGEHSLWSDEFYTVMQMQKGLGQLLTETIKTSQAPLYYILVTFWTRIFGMSEFSLRFPSLLFSFISIAIFYCLGRDLYEKKVGLIGAFLLSISPCAINYAQQCRPYALFWLTALLSFWFFYRALKINTSVDWILYIFFTILVPLTHYSGLTFIITQNVIFFVFFFSRKLCNKWLIGQGILILLLLPLLPLMFSLTQAPYLKIVRWISPVEDYTAFILFIGNTVTGNTIGHCQFWEPFLYMVLTACAFLQWKNKRLRFDFPPGNIILLGWLFIPLSLFIIMNICFFNFLSRGTIRYAAFLHLPLIMVCSKGASRLSSAGVIIILLLLSFTLGINHLLPYYNDNLNIPAEDWKGLYKRLNRTAEDNDLFIFYN